MPKLYYKLMKDSDGFPCGVCYGHNNGKVKTTHFISADEMIEIIDAICDAKQNVAGNDLDAQLQQLELTEREFWILDNFLFRAQFFFSDTAV